MPCFLFFRVVDLSDEGGGGRVVGESVLSECVKRSCTEVSCRGRSNVHILFVLGRLYGMNRNVS